MSLKKVIHWFRQDLRLSDNPAFFEAVKQGQILPIYILDDENAGDYKMGAASRFWLHHSLQSLNQSLGGKLSLYKGNPKDILLGLIDNYKIKEIYWNRCYEPWRIERDNAIKKTLQTQGVKVYSFNASLLWEPWDVRKEDNTPYKVFTPFYRKKCLKVPAPREPLPIPSNISLFNDTTNSLTINDLNLLPPIRWDRKIMAYGKIGEKFAQDRLYEFISNGLSNYKEGRNFPALNNVSHLSPYLHFGEISPNQVWYAAWTQGYDINIDSFCSELGWREFSYNLLYHFPDLPHKNLQSKFDNFFWQDNKKFLESWQNGQTGYPIVDAGMRELWQTGYMHNRVRMIVGSFLVKNLLIDWREGERWFWDCLLDADLANNSASWQWVAGCGADAAPYFRIFNPIMQGEKFDPEGIYTRRFVPELNDLPNKYLFCPWKAPEEILLKANISLGKTYPNPIVDIQESRIAALKVFKMLSKGVI